MTANPSLAPSTIALGGGCFWCLDAVFTRLKGVLAVESGFSNGRGGPPTYEQVCSGQTGHVEVVQIQFDSAQVSLRDLLQVFFHVHDPTTLNRQGADVGTQYRSGIYYCDEAQHQAAREALAEAQAVWGGRVVTEIAALQGYAPADGYHQGYFERNPQAGYCAFVIAPKVDKFRKAFERLLRDAA